MVLRTSVHSHAHGEHCMLAVLPLGAAELCGQGEKTDGAEGEAVIHPAALRNFRHTSCRVAQQFCSMLCCPKNRH